MNSTRDVSKIERDRITRDLKRIIDGTLYIEGLPWMQGETGAEILTLEARLGLFSGRDISPEKASNLSASAMNGDPTAYIVASKISADFIRQGKAVPNGLEMFAVAVMEDSVAKPKSLGAPKNKNWRRYVLILSLIEYLIERDYSETFALKAVASVMNGKFSMTINNETVRNVWRDIKLRKTCAELEALLNEVTINTR